MVRGGPANRAVKRAKVFALAKVDLLGFCSQANSRYGRIIVKAWEMYRWVECCLLTYWWVVSNFLKIERQ